MCEIKKIAKKYIEAGFSVIPIAKGEKRPSIDWKEYQTRHATDKELDEWFTDNKMNIGIVTGKISGITVVDIDAKSGGLETLKTLGLPITWTVKTGGGGWHYYYKYNEKVGQTAGIYQGIDIRNDGGQVVAPPSQHASGNRYEWTFKEELLDFPIDLFDTKEYKKTNWEELIKNGSKEGTRNEDASRLFGKLMTLFRPDEWETTVWNIALFWNSKNNPSIEEKELRNVFASISKRAIHNIHEPTEEQQDKKLKGKSASSFKDGLIAKSKEERVFYSWGTKWTDYSFPFLEKGTYTVFFGQQGSGKTTYCLHLARMNSKKHKVSFLTTEMSREKLIELYCIKRAGITDEEFKKGDCDIEKAINDHIPELDNINFIGIDNENLFQEYAIEEIQKIIEKNNPELLIIDNLDKITANKKTELEVSRAVSAGILQCARSTGVSIILIHHANKMLLDKRKQADMYQMRGLSGFRGTNKIADDADIIVEIGSLNQKFLENNDFVPDNTSKICAYKDRNFNRKGSQIVKFKNGEFIDGGNDIDQFNNQEDIYKLVTF
jgi:energy-coupling factor transporter ATP-binding protein EcfA2